MKPRTPATIPDLDRLIRRFREASPALEQPTHTELLTLVAWHLVTYDEATATEKLTAGLRAIDRARSRPSGVRGTGYNETLTIFWLTVARCSIPRPVRADDRAIVVARFVETFARKRSMINEYYSRELVHSWEARSAWTEPDLKPLRELCVCAAEDVP
ncbi:MAG: hypothetical protein AAGI17_09440 [Planctomycetota bacterium]